MDDQNLDRNGNAVNADIKIKYDWQSRTRQRLASVLRGLST